jgi:hypothetical protein
MDSWCWICGEWADPTFVRGTPSTTGGGFSATGGSARVPDPGAFVADADGAWAGSTESAREGEARTGRDGGPPAVDAAVAGVRASVAVSTDVGLPPPEVARMPAMPPDNASADTAARTGVGRLRNILLMTIPDSRDTAERDEG